MVLPLHRVVPLLLLLFIIPIVSAEVQSLPDPVVQGICANLPQIELNSSYENITFVQWPSGYVDLLNVRMQKNVFSYNYTYCNTTMIGTYIVNGCSDMSCWNYAFVVTPTGTIPTVTEGILYIAALIVLLIIFFGCFYGAVKIPWDNRRSEEGYVIDINDLKYVKIFLWWITYALAIVIAYIMYSLAYGFLYMNTMADIFKWVYWLLLGFFFPIVGVSFVVLVARKLNDGKLEAMIARGIPVK